ncbi:MAG: tetraacyldisaccharide 4'-kinase [Deltaproteobacteria bacterium]|nr:tetraacyldisaccharide 4'-kinase [Deltaproteobacteria bacterium]
MGAAGRDFHDFQTFFRDHPDFHVCCFTAHQIPFIDQRSFPKELAGEGYDADIPIHLEEELETLIERFDIDFVFLSYSDLSHEEVMHRASRVQAAGPSFCLLGRKHTQLPSDLPVISVTAVRTGCGKSPVAQALVKHLSARGIRVGVARHPMPYGDLRRQRVQRFAALKDLDDHNCTIEEREEYQPYIDLGLHLYAGVDYRAIFEAAAAESDVLFWDGGNNDFAFIRPGLSIVLVDALRPGHEVSFYPGETNLRSADVIVITKVDGAKPEDLEAIRGRLASHVPKAEVIESVLRVETDPPDAIKGKRVLVVEDGPTTTHGGMPTGAGYVAAVREGAAEIIDPRPFATGTIAAAYTNYPHMGKVLPALGYSDEQLAELAATITAAKADVVVDASPARVVAMLGLDVTLVGVRYVFEQRTGPPLEELVDQFLGKSS